MRVKSLLLLISILSITLLYTGHAQQFGKNKVQYQDFKWKYIESKHFDVYYNEGSKYLATFSAIEAEKALKSVQSTLNFMITNRIVIVVYDSHNEFQQTNVIGQFMPEGVGGVTELFKNRVVIPFEGSYKTFRHVIHHELVHAVLNDMLYGGTFQSAVSTSGNIQFPLWMNEGFAEYESIGGMNAETDMYMRDLVNSDLLPSLDRMDNYLAYRGGQTFYSYVARTYGEERVGDLLNRVRVNPSLDGTFRSSFNMRFEDFSEKWQKDLKKYYSTDLSLFDDLEDFSKRITDRKEERNYYNSSPAISPDGESMAYISDKNGTFSIFVQKIDDKRSSEEIISSFRRQDFEDLNVLTPGISWNPQGTKLAVSAKRGGEDAIFIVDVESEEYETLKFGIKSIHSVSWSPDGEKLAFIGTQGSGSDIYIYKFKTDILTKLTSDVFSDYYPVWSSDSETIYFLSDRGDDLKGLTGESTKMWSTDYERIDIYSINAGTKQMKRLTFEPEYTKTSIAVSADNSKLLYTCDKNGIGNIYELDIETGASKPKTNSINGITQLSLANDDSKLLFTAQVNAGYDIFMIKNPFDRHLQSDTLPLTKFRKDWIEKMAPVSQTVTSADTSNYIQKKISYGNYELSFDNQQMVKPNTNINTKDPKFASSLAIGQSIDTNFVEKDYKIKFTPDVIVGNPGYSTYWGFQGVAQMLFSDVLGDHQIYVQANLLLDLRNSSFLVRYSYLPDIVDYHFTAYHTAGFVYSWYQGGINQQPVQYLFRYREWGASVLASYPFDLFRRIEWVLDLKNVNKEHLDIPNSPLNKSRFLVVPEARYIYDDVLWGMFAPSKGTRFNVSVLAVPKLYDGGIGFMTVKGDIRNYLPIFGPNLTLATRITGAGSFGPDPQKFYLGGLENWLNPTFKYDELPFEEPEDFAFRDFVMPLRGWSVNEKQGNKYIVSNIELRFPLFGAFFAGPVPLLLNNLLGSAWLDFGATWTDKFVISTVNPMGQRVPENALLSMGFGIRTFMLGLPLKMDVAWRDEFGGWSSPYYLFTLGYDF